MYSVVVYTHCVYCGVRIYIDERMFVLYLYMRADGIDQMWIYSMVRERQREKQHTINTKT